MRKSIELRNELGTLNEEYKAVLNAADAAKRSVNTEEKDKLKKMDARLDELSDEIKLHEKAEARDAQFGGRREGGNPTGDPADPKAKNAAGIRASAEYVEAFENFVKTGRVGAGVSTEVRNALSSDSDTGGGYLTASEEFSNRIIEVVDNQVFMRGLATVTTLTSAQSLGIPTRTADVDDADWTSELATGTDDTGLVLGKRELKPHPLAKRIKISKKLMRLNPAVADLVARRLGYKRGVTEEKAYLTGNGSGQPLGVFTASTNGIDTSRDVVTGSSSGFIAPSTGVSPADCLIDALYTLKGQYQAKASWIFNRTIVQQIRKFKDQYGQFIWQPGLTAGEPDRILNRPFYMSEYAPNTLTTGLYVGIVGDFSNYEIVDALDMQLQVLMELYAEQNQVGYILRAETDGMPVLAEAFARIKCS
jgi:HK97 family phage major capsid protein